MPFRFAVLVPAVLFMPSIFIPQVSAAEDLVIHGTVNIALANQSGLILLTDSMITAGDRQLSNPGQKLFQLDDRTVCAIAGFVSASGPTRDLNADTSALIHQYVQLSRKQSLKLSPRN